MSASQRAVSEAEQTWRDYAELLYERSLKSGGQSEPTAAEAARLDAAGTRRAALLDALERDTGVSRRVLYAEASDAARQHGMDLDCDQDPDRFAPPDFAQLRERSAEEPEIEEWTWSEREIDDEEWER